MVEPIETPMMALVEGERLSPMSAFVRLKHAKWQYEQVWISDRHHPNECAGKARFSTFSDS